MKFYKLANIINFFIIGQTFIYALLIDDFTDNNITSHELEGVDIPHIKRNTIMGGWYFPKKGSRIAVNSSADENGLQYSVPVENSINFDNISTFNFKIISCSVTPKNPIPFAKFTFVDASSTTRTINDISLASMKSNEIFSIDLKNSSYGYVDEGICPFDAGNITGINIYFNTHGDMFEMNLDSIEAVPEPFSMITLAGGTLNLIRKKRRKNS